MIRLLIDGKGELWHPESREVGEHLGVGPNAAEHAVVQLGWVGYSEQGPRVRLWFDPATVVPVAIERALKYARSSKAPTLRIEVRINGVWRNETLPFARAEARIEELRFQSAPRPGPKFVATERPLQSLWADRQTALIQHIQPGFPR
jgi:hypothetical protein